MVTSTIMHCVSGMESSCVWRGGWGCEGVYLEGWGVGRCVRVCIKKCGGW